jgi:pimeloyl-ACP methyl ester carboxylesterase
LIARQFVSSESPSAGRAGAGGRPCQGLWHTSGPVRVGVVVTHYDVDFAEHYLAELLAARGLGFLGWNTRFRGSGGYFSLDHALTDIGVGVRWLRETAGVDTVVLLGNSGGASLMAAYQARALAGSAGLLPGDLFVSLNAHPGRPDVLTSWLDPSVTDESDPTSLDPQLDMFDPDRAPPFTDQFARRYRAAQRQRNQHITDWCHAELARLVPFGTRDRAFPVFRTWADLRFLDLALDPSARQVGCYAGEPAVANRGAFGLASTTTLRSWLAMWSLSDSQCRAEPHLATITQPALVVQSSADQGCYLSDARAIYDALASEDKVMEVVKGDHYLQTPPGAADTVADLIATWVDSRG